MSNNVVAAKNYPDDIFKQTTPDEKQDVGGQLLNVLNILRMKISMETL